MDCRGLPQDICIAQPQCTYTRRTSKRRPHCRKSIFKVAAEMHRRGMELQPVRRSNGRKSMKLRTKSSLRAKRRADKRKLLELFNEMGSPQLSTIEVSRAENPYGSREVVHEYIGLQQQQPHYVGQRPRVYRRRRSSSSHRRHKRYPYSAQTIPPPPPAAIILR